MEHVRGSNPYSGSTSNVEYPCKMVGQGTTILARLVKYAEDLLSLDFYLLCSVHYVFILYLRLVSKTSVSLILLIAYRLIKQLFMYFNSYCVFRHCCDLMSIKNYYDHAINSIQWPKHRCKIVLLCKPLESDIVNIVIFLVSLSVKLSSDAFYLLQVYCNIGWFLLSDFE